jgi:hypothetical protein
VAAVPNTKSEILHILINCKYLVIASNLEFFISIDSYRHSSHHGVYIGQVLVSDHLDGCSEKKKASRDWTGASLELLTGEPLRQAVVRDLVDGCSTMLIRLKASVPSHRVLAYDCSWSIELPADARAYT